MKMTEEFILRSNYMDRSTIFIIDDNVLIDYQTSSPLLPFGETTNKLNLKIESFYVDHSILFVRCHISLQMKKILNTGFQILNAKSFLNSINNEETQGILLRAIHWAVWDSRLQYCSKCGSKIPHILHTFEKKCPHCNHSFFPKLSPAVMVLIQRENEILLGRSAHFKPGVYSVLAGFIDIGETAELAVHREVKEEAGIEITELEYFGSQSWPFPDSFMLAFKAKYLRGKIKIDKEELEDARWFNAKNLPDIPPSPSISHQLIRSFILNRAL
ncbi:MAG: NAD(+) diphosphatase [Alphaproteobacteria bacterium]|nr:NAD(+) diphosphatase [Alphaproteobacteria bacterium]